MRVVSVGLAAGVIVGVGELFAVVGLALAIVSLGDISGTRPASRVSAMTVGKYSVGSAVAISPSPRLIQPFKKINKGSNSPADNAFTRWRLEHDCLVRIPVKIMPWIPDR